VIDQPYGPLVQNYQQCSNDVYQTLLNQAGIATGNIQVVAPMCVIFLMIVTALHKWWNKVPLDESYSKAEKDSALDAYAMALLLARDEKLKTHSFRGNNSIIALIAEELGEHTYLSAESHKSHTTSYSMSSLSSHSLSLSAPESPTARKIFDKINAFSGRTRSRSPSPGQVVHGEDEVEMQITTAPSSDLRRERAFDVFTAKQYGLYDVDDKHDDKGTVVQIGSLYSNKYKSNNRDDRNMLQVVDLEDQKSFAVVGSFSVPGDSERV
jgi:hypothetical protein